MPWVVLLLVSAGLLIAVGVLAGRGSRWYVQKRLRLGSTYVFLEVKNASTQPAQVLVLDKSDQMADAMVVQPQSEHWYRVWAGEETRPFPGQDYMLVVTAGEGDRVVLCTGLTGFLSGDNNLIQVRVTDSLEGPSATIAGNQDGYRCPKSSQ